jgi:hypothetical protein
MVVVGAIEPARRPRPDSTSGAKPARFDRLRAGNPAGTLPRPPDESRRAAGGPRTGHDLGSSWEPSQADTDG